MVASSRYPGHDEPYCYDTVAKAFIPISNVTAANTPISQATTGDWTPPTLADITNGRIMFTHPGFGGAATGNYIGWLDLSSASITSLKGNIVSGSNVISSINDGETSVPIADGVQPGQAISGAGIPAGSYVTAVQNGTFDLATTGNTNGTTALSSLASVAGVAPGMLVSGPQFAAGTTVVSISGTTVTLSTAALGTATGTAVNFTGGGSITISQNATATTNNLALTITGGTAAAPIWAAGNTNTNPLTAVATAVAQFNGRAYYAVANAVVFSDSLNPTQVTYASQALILGDSNPVTALSGLPLTNNVTGGTLQSLIAFKGAEPFYQITGDSAASTLSVSVVEGSVGTLAPNTICPTPLGLAFIAVDGLRILALTGVLSDPIGANGKGVSVPFIYASYPTRMCAAYGQNTLRVSVQNSQVNGQPWQEFFFDFNQKSWSGPHSFPASLISSFTEASQVGFVYAPQSVVASLWFHSIIPLISSIYEENGNPLSWTWQTSLLPDNEQMHMNRVVKTTIAMLLPPSQVVMVDAYDEAGVLLNSAEIVYINIYEEAIWDEVNWDGSDVFGPIPVPGSSEWGAVTWGSFTWGSASGYFKQRRVPWSAPVIFKQVSVQCAGASQAGFAIGNMYAGYQPLGYLLEDGL
jgi:hypothetical protein